MPSYFSPKIKKSKSSLSGYGIFAVKKILKNELVADFAGGKGKHINDTEAENLLKEGFDYMIQVNDNKHFAATNQKELELGDFLNHSCNPNCGF